MASLEDFPTEIITDIFLACGTIPTVLALSATSRRLRHIYAARRLAVLERAADAQFGPLHDLTQLLTHNASQPAHAVRHAPFTDALLAQMCRAGRVAEAWADAYPLKKWKRDFENRRVLRDGERRRLRRALYRLWLFARAFHNRDHPREARLCRATVLRRAALLRAWSTPALAEMADVHAVLRDVVSSNVCPSNGAIARRFQKRFPDRDHRGQLLFNIHLNYPPPPSAHVAGTGSGSLFFPQPPLSASPHPPPAGLAPTPHPPFSPFAPFSSSWTSPSAPSSAATAAATTRSRYAKYLPTAAHEPGAEGWGDDIPHYYVVEDMLKLDPAQLLWLREHAPLKGQVLAFVRALGDWFENNGETWGQTLEWVLAERGVIVAEMVDAVEEGRLGVAVGEGVGEAAREL